MTHHLDRVEATLTDIVRPSRTPGPRTTPEQARHDNPQAV